MLINYKIINARMCWTKNKVCTIFIPDDVMSKLKYIWINTLTYFKTFCSVYREKYINFHKNVGIQEHNFNFYFFISLIHTWNETKMKIKQKSQRTWKYRCKIFKFATQIKGEPWHYADAGVTGGVFILAYHKMKHSNEIQTAYVPVYHLYIKRLKNRKSNVKTLKNKTRKEKKNQRPLRDTRLCCEIDIKEKGHKASDEIKYCNNS